MEIDNTIFLDEAIIEPLKTLKQETHFKSRIPLILQHNGWRHKNIHMILGTAGGGKSTLVRTMLLDVLAFNKEIRVGIVLSEETREELAVEMLSVKPNSSQDFKRLHVFEEMNSNAKSVKELVIEIEQFIFDNSINILFYDNITTSDRYELGNTNDQHLFVKLLKKISIAKGIPIVLIAHTKSDITENSDKLISMNDVRGSKSIVNLAQFFYILQRFTINDFYYPTVKIIKHRGYVVDQVLFRLKFNKQTKVFSECIPITFNEFKEAYSKRDRL